MLQAIRCVVLSMVMVLSYGLAQAAPIIYTAVLNGNNEVPPVVTPGNGIAAVGFDQAAHLLNVDVLFNTLLAPTTAAHIHAPAPPGVNAPVAIDFVSVGFPLGVPNGIFHHLFDTSLDTTYNPAFLAANGGSALGAEAALGFFLSAGLAYANVHTTTFPGGEIRGQLAAQAAPIPEPATLVLIGSALAGSALCRRLRKHA